MHTKSKVCCFCSLFLSSLYCFGWVKLHLYHVTQPCELVRSGDTCCAFGCRERGHGEGKASLQQHTFPPLWLKDSRRCCSFPQASRSSGWHVVPRDRAPSAQGSVITVTPLRVHRWFCNPSFQLLLTTLDLPSSLSKYCVDHLSPST